jgi:hypothetical protein
MKRDVKSLLSVPLAAMGHPSSSNVDTPSELSLCIRDDLEIRISSDIVDDYIPLIDGIPTSTFRWHGEASYSSLFSPITRRPLPPSIF